jgi:S-adenosylmethionine:tRNA ribosyltransferase-isomerase
MRLDEFDFDLPEALIALRPARPRRAARLLVAHGDAIGDSQVARLGDWLAPGDLLVTNDTRVLPARLSGVRRRPGGQEVVIEAVLVAPAGSTRAAWCP